MLRHFYVILVVFLIVALPCEGFAEDAALKWVGCGISRAAFMTDLAAAYTRKTGKVIDLEGGGDHKGMQSVAKGEADMGGSCRNVLPGVDGERGLKLSPVAWDALVAIVHKENPVSDISLDQLRRVYLGEITNWKQLGGPDQPVKLFVRKGTTSGVGHTVRDLMFGDHDMEFLTSYRFNSSAPLEKAIEIDPYAIGMTGISSARKRDVKILDLEGKTPDYTNIRSGEYLLYRPLYLLTNRAGPRYNEVRDFLSFAHSAEGKKIIIANGVVPYLDALHLVSKQRQQWKRAHAMQEKND